MDFPENHGSDYWRAQHLLIQLLETTDCLHSSVILTRYKAHITCADMDLKKCCDGQIFGF